MKRKYVSQLLICLSAAATAFSFCGEWYSPILYGAFIACILKELKKSKDQSFKKCFAKGFVYAFVMYFISLFWISSAFEFASLQLVGLFAIFLLGGYVSSYFALSFAVTAKYQTNDVQRCILFALVFGLAEYVRSFIITGFPWNMAAHTIVGIPYLAQAFKLMPKELLNIVVIFIYASMTSRRCIKYGVGLVALMVAYSAITLSKPVSEDGDGVMISIIQPSYSQSEKMNQSNLKQHIDGYLKMSKLKIKSDIPRVIIWGEGAVEAYINESNGVVEYISDHINDENTIIITGANRRVDDALYNSAVVIGNAGILDHYDKRHLVMFGEYIPFVKTGSFSRGDPARSSVTIFNKYKTKIDICYESCVRN